MNTVEIKEKGIFQEYPSNWGEMNEGQIACVFQNWIKVLDGKINEHEFLLIVLYQFLGMKRGPFQNVRDKRLSEEQLEIKFANVWQLTNTLKWLIRTESKNGQTYVFLNFGEIKNLLPSFENDGEVKLFGPADGMLNISFGEIRRATRYFEDFAKFKRHADLDHLIATLYRPKREDYPQFKHGINFSGDIREEYNPHLTPHYAELLSKVPFWKKYLIYTWFGNCDRFIKTEELELDGKPISFTSLFSQSQSTPTDEVETLDENDLGMTGLLFMLTESKLFGDINEVDKTSYFDVLVALLYWKQQSDKMKIS